MRPKNKDDRRSPGGQNTGEYISEVHASVVRTDPLPEEKSVEEVLDERLRVLEAWDETCREVEEGK